MNLLITLQKTTPFTILFFILDTAIYNWKTTLQTGNISSFQDSYIIIKTSGFYYVYAQVRQKANLSLKYLLSKYNYYKMFQLLFRCSFLKIRTSTKTFCNSMSEKIVCRK